MRYIDLTDDLRNIFAANNPLGSTVGFNDEEATIGFYSLGHGLTETEIDALTLALSQLDEALGRNEE